MLNDSDGPPVPPHVGQTRTSIGSYDTLPQLGHHRRALRYFVGQVRSVSCEAAAC